jgi:hypothetical protein
MPWGDERSERGCLRLAFTFTFKKGSSEPQQYSTKINFIPNLPRAQARGSKEWMGEI